jgi:hypothetical protein
VNDQTRPPTKQLNFLPSADLTHQHRETHEQSAFFRSLLGGKDKNKHRNKRSHITGGSGKVAVIGAISRKGMVVAQGRCPEGC